MELMEVSKLRSHPRNTEFFDDIVGEPWTAFLESIKTSGVIEPIIATQDLVIVSGHQRVRACKQLKIPEVLVDVRVFDSEDEVLKQLIETNIRQRGVGNTNAVKLGRCIVELERIYGIAHGGDRKSSGNNFNLKTQEDLAAELEMSKRQMANYKSLTDLIPELQEAVQSGKITATTAMGLVKQLSHEEQEQLADMIVDKEKLTNRQVEFYKRRVQELNQENIKLNKENSELKERKPEVVEKEVEVVPEDYENLKKDVEGYKKDYAALNKQYNQMADKWKAAEEKLQQQEEPENKRIEKIKISTLSFCAGVANFFERFGGYVWLTNEINNMEINDRKKFLEAVNGIYAWSYQMKENING